VTVPSRSRGQLTKLLREPLVHFIVIGAALFALFTWFTPESEEESRRIVITQERLLEFMQYRNQAFSDSARDRLEEMLRSMTPAQKANLVDEYIREEVLHREALAMGLDSTDYVIRRRLAQTMEYVLRDSPEEDLSAPSYEELRQFFLNNVQRYQNPARATLRHVFFDASSGEVGAEKRARSTLTALRSNAIDFEAALTRSDRFPYFQDYADEPRPLIESHLGPEVADAAFLKPVNPEWQGPYRSRSGFHLIQVTRRSPPSTPNLESVREVVANDLRNAKVEERLERRIKSLIGQYRVESTLQ
jgi:parvulin-like peptidyl-prolyl isomerase